MSAAASEYHSSPHPNVSGRPEQQQRNSNLEQAPRLNPTQQPGNPASGQLQQLSSNASGQQGESQPRSNLLEPRSNGTSTNQSRSARQQSQSPEHQPHDVALSSNNMSLVEQSRGLQNVEEIWPLRLVSRLNNLWFNADISFKHLVAQRLRRDVLACRSRSQ